MIAKTPAKKSSSQRLEHPPLSALCLTAGARRAQVIQSTLENAGMKFVRFEFVSSPDEATIRVSLPPAPDLLFIDEPQLDEFSAHLEETKFEVMQLPPCISILDGKLLHGNGAARKFKTFDTLTLDSLRAKDIERITIVARGHNHARVTTERHRALENLIASIATNFLKLPSAETDGAIIDALARSALFANVDRAYLFLISDDNASFSMTHEWCGEGIPSTRDSYEGLSVDAIRPIYDRLQSGENVVCDDLSEVPPENRIMRELGEKRGVRSFALVPLLYGTSLRGVLGFTQVTVAKPWSDFTVTLLRILGEILINAVQRKRTEEAILGSEAKFRTVVEGLGEGLVLSDVDDHIIHVNSRMVEMVGYSREEMIGKRADTLLLPPGKTNQIRDGTKRRLQGITESYVVQLLRKNSTYFWAEISAAPIRNGDGKIIGTVGAITDITDRKEAIDDLKASETKYRNLVETSSDLIWSVDHEGRWTFVNQAAERIFGYQPQEMLGRRFTEFQSLEVSVRDKVVHDHLLKGNSIFEYESEYIRKDGGTVQLRFNAIVRRDIHGNIVGTTGTASDMSFRKKAEAALNKSETRFKRYFDLPLIGIGVSNPQRRWIELNDKFCSMLGYEKVELLNKPWADFTHPDDLPNNLHNIETALKTGSDQWTYEKRFIKKDGSILFTLTSGACVRARDGSVDYYLAIHQDITQRKSAEENSQRLQRQLLQAQKMEAIGQLAAGVAHDLNNALAAVVGHLQLLRMGSNNSDGDQNSIETALNGCKRASLLTEQLLGFSRQGKYNVEIVPLQRFTRETIDFLRKVIASNISIAVNGSEHELTVRGDASQMQQVLTNLIINATQAMKSGGSITFRFGSKQVLHPERLNPSAKPGNYNFVSIEDTGGGIPASVMDKIFEPFFTTKAKSSGTGLGLSTVYGTMQGHGGWVEVESVVGKGSIFSLYFPEAKGVVLEVVQQKPKDLHRVSGTVVVIDDEQVLVDLGQEFLRRAGLRTYGFTAVDVALQWYRTHWQEVDLIVLDMKMPKMDGGAAFAEILAIDPEAQVVILSGYSQDVTAQKLLRAGALKFFQKPLKYPELVSWIIGVLAKSNAA